MLNNDTVASYIQGHEGLSLKPYYCTANKLSIGIGRNLDDRGITKEEALLLFANDMRLAVSDLYRVFGEDWKTFPDNVQLALIDMMFQLGLTRFCGFKKTIEYLKAGNWKEAAREMMDSKYAQQVPKRAAENKSLIESA